MAIAPWKKQLPMYATYSRIVVAPFLVLVLLWDWEYSGPLAAILFILFSITDYLDGYWARKYQAESVMGKMMDPIADKIIVLSALIILLHMHRVDPYMVIILLARDIFIGGIRSVAAANSVIIAAKPFGKWKTGIQMFSIPCLCVYNPYFGIPFAEIGYYGLWISVALSVVSGVQYTSGYYKGRSV